MLENFCQSIIREPFVQWYGKVTRVGQAALRVTIPKMALGSICSVQKENMKIPLEVVNLDPEGHVAMPLNDLSGVLLGDRVLLEELSATVPVGNDLLGKVVDCLCIPYEGSSLSLPERVPLNGLPVNPMDRKLIDTPIDLGIRSINGFLTCGRGQRMGIFAGSGVGKSVLLGMIARFTSADVIVIALIGERGREVGEFIEKELGQESLRNSVVVVETAERSPVRRVRGAYTATAICEFFRRQGKHVLFLMDSLTRFAMAQREIGIAAGEPPTTKGYPPSVYGRLARLTERSGNWDKQGSITGLYTILVEGDDLEDPVADASRAILDGHIVLSRKLAERSHFPSVDILASVSRVRDQIVNRENLLASRKAREIFSRYLTNEDAIQFGMYIRGTDLALDDCIDREPKISNYLQQGRDEKVTLSESMDQLQAIIK